MVEVALESVVLAAGSVEVAEVTGLAHTAEHLAVVVSVEAMGQEES